MFLRRAVGQFPKKFLSQQKVLEKNDARDAEAMGKNIVHSTIQVLSDVKEVLAQVVSR